MFSLLAGKIPAAAKKQPKYLGPTPFAVAKITYPTPPMIVRAKIMSPRCWVRSAIHVVRIVRRNDKKNGGAVSPCASTFVKPISERIVGRKTGSDAKLTLQLKYISYSASAC